LAGLLVSAAGCNKDEPTNGTAAKAGTTAAGKAATAAPVPARLAAPDNVVAFGGTAPLSASLDTIHALAAQVVPSLPKFQAMVAPAIQGEYRLKDAAAIDANKAIRFAVFDPKTYRRDPTALMVGITGDAALIAALPTTGRKADDQGNAHSYLKFEGSSRPIFVNFVPGYVVFSRNKDTFPKNADFLKSLASAKLPDLGAAYIEIEHLMKLFGPEFDKGLKQAEAEIMHAVKSQPSAANSVEMMRTMFQWTGKAAKELEHVRISLVAVADGVKLDVRAVAKKGSPLATLMGQMKGNGSSALLGKLPTDSAAFVAGSMEPAALSAMSDMMANAFIVGPMFKGDQAKAKPYLDAMRAYTGAMDGQMALGAYPSTKGVAMAALLGITDAKTARESMNTLAAMYADPTAKTYYEALGIEMKYQKDAYEVAGTKAVIMTTTMKNMPPEAAQMMALMGDFMTQHFAIGDKLGVLGYGVDGRAIVEGVLTGTLKGGLHAQASVKRALKEAAPGFFGIGWINPIAMGRAVKLGGMNPLAQMLAGVPATSGVAISFAAQEGSMQMVLDVPVTTVKEGMAAFEKSKGSL
jgi:hypothetical protein